MTVILLDCYSTSRIQMLQGYIQNLRKGIITCSTVANLMLTSLEDLLKIGIPTTYSPKPDSLSFSWHLLTDIQVWLVTNFTKPPYEPASP
jgi:hypothetical protein